MSQSKRTFQYKMIPVPQRSPGITAEREKTGSGQGQRRHRRDRCVSRDSWCWGLPRSQADKDPVSWVLFQLRKQQNDRTLLDSETLKEEHRRRMLSSASGHGAVFSRAV